MTKRTVALISFVILGTLVAFALPNHHLASSPADVGTLNVTIQEWAVPTKGAPHDPAVGADGALWFTEQMVNKLGRLDPKTGEFKSIRWLRTRIPGRTVWWRTKREYLVYREFGGYIGSWIQDGQGDGIQNAEREGGRSAHGGVRWARILWFTVQGGNMVGRLDPKNGKMELKEVPTAAALPYGIQINSKGVPVFCELGTNKMASIDPQSLTIKEYALPEGVRPRRLAIAADDPVYFTDFKSGHLGTLNTSTGVKLYGSPGGAEANPYGLRLHRMGWCGTASLACTEHDRAVDRGPKRLRAPTFHRAEE
jgi:virginiamycin B lyase